MNLNSLQKGLIGAACAALTLTSCTKENNAPAISNATLSATSVEAGDTITITATATDADENGGIATISVDAADASGAESAHQCDQIQSRGG